MQTLSTLESFIRLPGTSVPGHVADALGGKVGGQDEERGADDPRRSGLPVACPAAQFPDHYAAPSAAIRAGCGVVEVEPDHWDVVAGQL
ncbi:MAG TPA: hypothetical protein VLW50_09275 [Streptosporangiaceae bacterium]|nr:hypothetical protein [Streptosporangiaceae bacterium]